MPSIGHRPLRYKSKYAILKELQHKRQKREVLLELFNSTIGKHLPTKKPAVTAGYKEQRFQHKTPKRDQLRFNQLLYELKRDGLAVGDIGQGALIRITAAGLRWLEKCVNTMPFQLPQYTGPAEQDSRVTIVTYDIPEKSAAIRKWLHRSLRRIGMSAIQQSVFVGAIKLPADFLQSIIQLKLEKCVEISEISKAGTLRKHLQRAR